ncbi:S9 family peptidase [Rhodothermaceae bacterium RA]|nr:S9 family peptidase [Rhodothermaceae bacterium RA]
MKPLFRFLLVALMLAPAIVRAQPAPLTVQQIMQDPDTWIGDWPDDPFWSEDGSTLYFSWNPQGQFAEDSLFKVPRGGGAPVQVPSAERRNLPPRFDGWHHGEHVYDAGFRRKVYARDGDLYLHDRTSGATTRLTHTRRREGDPRFTPDGTAIVFTLDDNLFRMDRTTGAIVQLTDLRSGPEPKDPRRNEQDRFLEAQQQALFDLFRRRKEEREAREAAERADRAAEDRPPTFYTGDRQVQQLRLDPTGRFVSFTLYQRADDTDTEVMDYVTESGYADVLRARPKVGAPGPSQDLYVQDLARDTTYRVDLHQVPGAYDPLPFQTNDDVADDAADDVTDDAAVDSSRTKRDLFAYGPYWSGDGRYAVVEIRARDNKDRWIARLDAETGTLTVLDRQHDAAWIAGPGISWFGGRSTMGWLPDHRRFFFQSEASGYSHLYTVDVETGTLTQLTAGEFEVFDPMISRDGRSWFFLSSEGSPFERHVYRMPIDGGPRTRLTTMAGRHELALNPDEQTMALRHDYSNRPPEIFLQPIGGSPERITTSPTAAWSAYPWRDPAIVTIEASDGAEVPARLYEPAEPNGAAVLFVHGAGYLQNVHRGWSSYFREYMFHNLLADRGYVVLDLDYRASAGYGRDWRTAIYRHMGGRDLQDYVDASRYVGQRYGIDPERVFIYGGSYGGFITLMALFTEPEHFGAGAALRAVTDWAHYNHPYTANILNTPAEDSLAYARSSPIYFAEGLADPLLMCHGLIDTNVQPQDIFRLVQRLIELGKEDWELAVYPVEGHGFTEPSSWTDEYRRILALIEDTVGPNRHVAVPTDGATEDAGR